MAFAPTRSGKGVGLVVPTLLTWPGSAVIHDIKGENWQLTAGWRARFSHCLLFDPTNAASAAYNPLLEVRTRRSTRCATCRTSPTSWSIRKARSNGAITGRRPVTALLVGAILHVLYAEADKTLARRRQLPVRSGAPDRDARCTRMMTTPASGRRPSASGGRLGRARGAQQERERALRRALDRDELPRPLSRSDRRRGHVALRLAHRRSDRRPSVRSRSTWSCRPPTSAAPSR